MRHFDIANGLGIRTTLFVSGCTHNCPGCFNKPYQDFNYGKPWDEAAKAAFMQYMQDPNVHGVTLLGGEPMDQTMDSDLLELVKMVKEEAHQNLWIFSGYTFEQIIADEKKKEILTYCDVLVDGPFVEALKDIKLKFRGSSNQRIIDVKASLKEGKVILKEELM